MEPFLVEDGYLSVEIFRSRQLMVNLASPDSAWHLFFPGLDFFGVFICKVDLLIETRLDELEIFPAGLEEDVL